MDPGILVFLFFVCGFLDGMWLPTDPEIMVFLFVWFSLWFCLMVVYMPVASASWNVHAEIVVSP